jgi:hypothetical protein
LAEDKYEVRRTKYERSLGSIVRTLFFVLRTYLAVYGSG